MAAQLEGAGLVTRKPARISLHKRAGAEEIAQLLDAYEQRRAQDRDRLDTMMRYAQSPQCRSRLLHEYFDDPVERDCGHCDNCNAHAQGLPAAGIAKPEPLPAADSYPA